MMQLNEEQYVLNHGAGSGCPIEMCEKCREVDEKLP